MLAPHHARHDAAPPGASITTIRLAWVFMHSKKGLSPLLLQPDPAACPGPCSPRGAMKGHTVPSIIFFIEGTGPAGMGRVTGANRPGA